jgi:hypothetical protein
MNAENMIVRAATGSRYGARVHSLKDIHLVYEGEQAQTAVRTPDLSERGMFINTTRLFPEGAILKLRFRLAATNAEIDTRCEVRYCQPGTGIGVEFISLTAEAERAIQREIAMSGEAIPREKKARRKPKRRRPRKSKIARKGRTS